MITIKQASVGLKEKWGRFVGILQPGLHFYIPGVEDIHVLPTNTRTVPYKFSVKTKDNVFVTMSVTVSYKVGDPERAFYNLRNPDRQISDAIEDSVRGSVSNIDLDHLFEDRTTIQKHVDDVLSSKLESYGYDVESVFVTEIEPDPLVKEAMNAVVESQRRRDAAQYTAETQSILIIKEAEANKERQRLNGEGIAAMRQAMVEGYQKGVEDLASKLDISPKEAICLVLSAQYMDILEKMSHSNNTKTIFIPSSPSSAMNVADEFMKSMLQVKEV